MTSPAQPQNLVDLFEGSLTRHADRPLFGTAGADGEYAWRTYAQVGRRVDGLRAGLAGLGVRAGDAVGIIANNRPEWAMLAFASFGLGARFVPMYEKELTQTWKHIIGDAAIKVLFVANADILGKVEAFRADLPHLESVFLIDGTSAPAMDSVEEKGRTAPIPSIKPAADDIAVLIYTSGTTGAPKGVLLSHGNFTSNVLAGSRMFPELDETSCSLSILPWAHSYGQTAELYNFIFIGGAIGIMRDVTTLAEDMTRVAPTFLIAVPRVFNKIHDGLWDRMNQTGGLARRLFVMGLSSAARIRTASGNGGSTLIARLKYKLADRIVFRRIRQRFGGRLQGALTASARMNETVLQFFADIGLPVYEAYGLTETSPAVTMNNVAANRPGSVGRPIDGVRVVIDKRPGGGSGDDGEVVVYGPNVMQGYHNRPEETRQVMTADGGFRTGDLGRLDADGFLFITGRIKEQYKLENGKYVFPAAIEEELQLLPWVENVLVYGEGRHYNVCIVAPDMAKLSAMAGRQGLTAASAKALMALPEVQAMAEAAIEAHLKEKFGGYEIPKRVVLVEEPFSVDNGMLTQTLKVKRRKVVERYGGQIEAAYGASA